jgi:glycosyltransferase involved in cell wall biosynthesis
MILFFIIMLILGVIIVITLYNFFTAPVLKPLTLNKTTYPLISVLIPARNEAYNIDKCLNYLLNQDYKNLELIVLDDNSEDNTKHIVESFSKKHNHIQLLKGKELPEGWLGKNWACNQLSQQAKGQYLLFIDADVEIQPDAISAAIEEMKRSETKMLSVFSTQIIRSFGEWLVVPLMNWMLLAFLPLKLVYASRKKSFVAANGQFMFWERKTYFEIGGHEIVKDKVVEDMEFARICKSKNIRIKTLLGGNLIYCKMYSGLSEAIRGFAKNFYPGFNINSFVFLVMITFFVIIFLLPFILVFINNLYFIPIVMIVLIRIIISINSRQNAFLNVLLHPLQLVLMYIVGIKSIINAKTGKLDWKGRHI